MVGAPGSLLGDLARHPVYDDVCWFEVGEISPALGYPVH
jgi:hypothetical protein